MYIEGFLGSGAILRHKLPAIFGNIGIDADPAALEHFLNRGHSTAHLININFFEWIDSFGSESLSNPDTFLYLDPPYPMNTRSSGRPLYNHEFTDADHARLLSLIVQLKCLVMISSYWNNLYADRLTGWRTHHFTTTTRGGNKSTEWLWMNYPPPFELHDYRYLGSNFRQRDLIKRKKLRWYKRLRAMNSLERFAILEVIDQLKASTSIQAITPGTTSGATTNIPPQPKGATP